MAMLLGLTGALVVSTERITFCHCIRVRACAEHMGSMSITG